MKVNLCLHSKLILFSLLVILVSKSTAQSNEVDILFHQRIPMRDGINLSATIYMPTETESPLPVILIMTPYIQQLYTEYGFYFVENGFVFVYADLRGRGDSEGVFTPFKNDGKDGYDVIEWIAKQPWCNGRVGMMGGSYLGMIQWLTLKESPPSLYSIAPTAPVAPGIDFPFYNNIFSHYMAQWLSIVGGRTNDMKINESAYWETKKRIMFNEYIPFSKYKEIMGMGASVFHEWIRHPGYDEYWKNKTPSIDDYHQMGIPTLTITGYFDGDQQGALHYYTNLMKYASDSVKQRAHLLVGPWNHFGTAFPSDELGGLKFGENAVLDMKKLHLDWFNWTLKHFNKPESFRDNVQFYEMGSNEWKYASTLEEVSNDSLMLYLSSNNGQAWNIFESGKLLSTIQGNQVPDTIVYDPLDITAINLNESSDYLSDQSEVFKPGRLIYHSFPLEEDITVAGNIKVHIFLQINTPDMDIEYNVYEIDTNGESIFLTSDKMRARYRNSPSTEELLNPQEIYRFEFDSEFFLVRRVNKGSRLRIVINAVNSPEFQKNYNSGKDVSLETSKDARTAIIKLFHDRDYPSNIVLPLLR